MAIDTIAVGLGLSAATAVRSPGDNPAAAMALVIIAYSVWIAGARLYRSRLLTRRTDEIRLIVNASIRTAATVGFFSFVFDLSLDRLWLAIAMLATLSLLVVDRELVRRQFVRGRIAGRFARPVLMIGRKAESDQFAEMFVANPDLGYNVVGRVEPRMADDPNQLTTAVLAEARQNGAFGVIIAASAIDMQSSNHLIRDLVEAGLHVELTSTLADISPERLTVRPLGRFPVVYIEPRHRHGWRAAAKRTFDLVLALVALTLLAPLLMVVGLLVKVGAAGPILFRQERVGKDGEPFMVLKFRTMVVDAEKRLAALSENNEGAGPLFKMKDDPRVTRIGAFLRKTSLDELPQLWNVVRNEMSLVGPRPALRAEMAEWDDALYARLRVKPGITGMWQVSGRSSTSFEEYTRLDLYYVDNWSLVVDLSILLRTIPAVLRSDGAY